MTEIAGKLGNYEVVSLLGRGRHTEVYLGQHIHLKTQAAIKIFHADLSEDERAARLAGLRRVAALRHPHIARILEFGSEHDMQFLVSEYAVRGSLRLRHMPGERLPLSVIISYVQSIAAALHYAHERGLVHAAIKPENMLVRKDERLVLADFRALPFPPVDNSTFPIKPEHVDTPAYLAPEQWQGRYSPASDQYALAIVVYEWLSGAPLFHGSPTALREQHLHATPPLLQAATSQIPYQLEQVLHKALAKDPQERFASIHDFALALAQAVGMPLSPAEQAQPPSPPVLTQSHQLEPTQPAFQKIDTFPSKERTAAQYTTQRQISMSSWSRRPILILCVLLALSFIGGGLFIFRGGIAGTSQSGKPSAATLTAMSPQDRYIFVTSNKPIVNDHLNQPQASQWQNEQKNQGKGSCAFQKSSGTTAYHLSAQTNAPPVICLARGSNFGNFAFQASLQDQDQQDPYSNDSGLAFCSDSTGNNFYLFSIAQEGYAFTRYQAGQINQIKSGTLPFSIYNNGKGHQLTTIADNGYYSFYLDGQALTSQTQTTPCSGSIGFFVASKQKSPADYIFKDARVWQL